MPAASNQSGRFVLRMCTRCRKSFLVDTSKPCWRPRTRCEACVAYDAASAAAKKRRLEESARRQEMRTRLARRDLEYKALHTRVAVTVADGVRIERRGQCPLGCHAASFVSHNA